MSAGRKVFYCAVDETALTTNISEIKKWAANGAIILIVPLYSKYPKKQTQISLDYFFFLPILFFFFFSPSLALERLHGLKRAGSQVAINAREAVRFLDRVTSGKDNMPTDRVILQGPMEQFENWADAEQFFLPEFEEEPEAANGTTVDDESAEIQSEEHPAESGKAGRITTRPMSDDLSQMLLSKLNFKKEPDAVSITSNGTHSVQASGPSSRSSRASPEWSGPTLPSEVNDAETHSTQVGSTNGHRRTASGSTIPTVPAKLRPLLSALLWRLHCGPDASNTAKSCILITNDRITQTWAQKFGIGVKNIHQLRTAIQYEEREYKNRCKYAEKSQVAPVESKSLLSYDDKISNEDEESEEDELVFVPRGRGKISTRNSSARGGSSRKAGLAAKSAGPPVAEVAMEIPTEPIDPNSFSRDLGVGQSKPRSNVEASQPAGTSRRAAGGRRGGLGRGAPRGSSRGRGKLWVP